MKYIRTSILVLVASMLTYCSKSSGGTEVTPTVPTNLTINATVNSDASGSVNFTASATNATTYDYDFGNGVFQTVASGVVTYTYPESGTYTVSVIAKSKDGKTISKSTQVTVAITSSVTWSEEFNTPGAPDPAKWGYDLGAGGWGNEELEYYTNRSENVTVSGGMLKITAKKETFNGSPYTSA
ncbi:MAG: PKD domain-containing protein, partial [Cytophagaceae bacterium]